MRITIWEKAVALGRKEIVDRMREFDYSKLADRTWDNEIISYISKIHEYKGKQELFLRQKPVELERLIEIAKIQSTEASNRIEGIITTGSRLKQLVADKTTPKNRDEEEILGYRNVLNLVHENYYKVLLFFTLNYILSMCLLLVDDLATHIRNQYFGYADTGLRLIVFQDCSHNAW